MIRLAVFGHPVAHSRSPALHRAFAAQASVDVDYRAIECRAGALAEALADFAAAGGRGCNLTVPLKEEGARLADRRSAAVSISGAANTLVRDGDAWTADNTDGAGLVADLDRLGIDVSGRRVLVVGAGGAAAGVLPAVAARGPAALHVVNRTAQRAEELAARIPADDVALRGSGFEGIGDSGFEVILQATSLGHDGKVPPLDPAWLAGGAVAYDLNYGDAHGPFADWCAERGVACHDGIGMLVEQAALAFERFTGFRPETGPVHEAMRRG